MRPSRLVLAALFALVGLVWIGQGVGLDQEQRHDLLAAFDLKGLARLAPAGSRQARLGADRRRPVRTSPAVASERLAGQETSLSMEPAT